MKEQLYKIEWHGPFGKIEPCMYYKGIYNLMKVGAYMDILKKQSPNFPYYHIILA